MRMYAVVVAAVGGLDRLAVNQVVVARSRGDWEADIERRRRVGAVGARPVRLHNPHHQRGQDQNGRADQKKHVALVVHMTFPLIVIAHYTGRVGLLDVG